MKYALVSIFFLLQPNLQAYQSPEFKFVVTTPAQEAAKVQETAGLGLSRLEINTKNSLAKTKIEKPREFEQIKNDKLNNSDLYQSWINEVDEALNGRHIKSNPKEVINFYKKYVEGTPVDLAKKIAKKQMFYNILRNWETLKDTIFNEYDVQSKAQAKAFAMEVMDKGFVYVPRPHAKSYLFLLGESYVEIAKDLRSGRTGLDVNSRLDSNALVPEASKIVPDDEGKRHSARSSQPSTGNNSGSSNSGVQEQPPTLPEPSNPPDFSNPPPLESF